MPRDPAGYTLIEGFACRECGEEMREAPADPIAALSREDVGAAIVGLRVARANMRPSAPGIAERYGRVAAALTAHLSQRTEGEAS